MPEPNFYQDPPPEDAGGEPEAPSKVKLGDKEYSQDELKKLVGLGEIGAELESKWKTPISEVYKGFTQKSQKLAELEPEYQKLKDQAEAATRQVNTNTDLTPEQKEQAKRAIIDLLGGEPLRKEEFGQYYVQRRAAESLLEDVDSVVEENKSQGKPETTKEALLNYMSETGIRNPAKAYKDMFESELDTWKQDQLKKVKPTGLNTQSSSSAGSKNPNQPKITRDNLTQLLSEVVNRE